MLQLPEVPGVFCDAHLIDDGGLRFLSVWGRDTAVQEYLARLSVPESEGGIRAFWIGRSGQDGARHVPSVDTGRLLKVSARRSGTVFGELVQVWLYDRLAVEPDRANGRGLLLHRSDTAEPIEERLWSVVKDTLRVPVLEHWRDTLLSRFGAMEWIRRTEGYRIGGFLIDLSERDGVEECIAHLVKGGHLALEPEADRAAA